MGVEREIGCVEESHEPDLGLERIHSQCDSRRAVVAFGDGELQLCTVRVGQQAEQLG
jgi:hypothetical protein